MNTRPPLLARSLRSWMSRDATLEGPRWLLWVWTGLLCAVIALGFTVAGMGVNLGRGGSAWQRPDLWARWFGINLVVSSTIGAITHLLFDTLIPWVGVARVRSFTRGQRAAFYGSIPLVGLAVGWPLAVWLVGDAWGGPTTVAELLSSFVIALLISSLIYLYFSAKSQQIEAEKQALESQLRLLQAQMEPHFLFNTLANVLTLIEVEPARARRMLESFTDYLRATLGTLRQDRATLGSELDLADAYLRLLQLRMEDRLRFDIEADAEIRAAALPPLMLQPLVENAIHHGLEPKVEGGRLSVRAQLAQGQLLVTVSDDGLGPDAPRRRGPGNGMALDNIRRRLQALYGDAASLSIEPLQPGTRATLRLPFLPPATT